MNINLFWVTQKRSSKQAYAAGPNKPKSLRNQIIGILGTNSFLYSFKEGDPRNLHARRC